MISSDKKSRNAQRQQRWRDRHAADRLAARAARQAERQRRKDALAADKLARAADRRAATVRRKAQRQTDKLARRAARREYLWQRRSAVSECAGGNGRLRIVGILCVVGNAAAQRSAATTNNQ